jgi:phospholipid-binding lipoprotein MlaA
MRISSRIAFFFLLVVFFLLPALASASSRRGSPAGPPPSPVSKPTTHQRAALGAPPSSPATEETIAPIPDPIEPVNRFFFHFNDKLYFLILRPAATGYKAVFPEPLRVGVKNFFSNLTTPIRFVNCLLQGNFKGAGNETVRFGLNSTLGLAGFLDPAKKELKIEKQDEDFGQTLGVWGMGPLLYIEWPFLGASSIRDSVGYVGDLALDPVTYVGIGSSRMVLGLAIRSYEEINDHSLTLGDYEDLKRAALDPYVAKRDAYNQYRRHKIKEKGNSPEPAGNSKEPEGRRFAQAAFIDFQKETATAFNTY